MNRYVSVTALLLAFLSHPVLADEQDLLPLGDPARAYTIASTPQGGFYDCRTGSTISFDSMIRQMADSRIILLGEHHDNMEQHLLQARIIEALHRLVPNLTVGMEFFQRTDNDLLRRWVAGEMDLESFLKENGWYDRGGIRFEYYQPVMDLCRRQGIPVRGLNVPRSVLRTVSRGGLAALDESQQAIVGPILPGTSPGHRYLVSLSFGETIASMPERWLDNMVSAQCLWDIVMARSILDGLVDGGTMIVLAGSVHVAYGLGIPRRIQEEAGRKDLHDLAVLSFCPVIAPVFDPDEQLRGHPGGMGNMDETLAPPALFVRSLADIVGVFEDRGEYRAFPSLGLSLKENENGILSAGFILPDSIAWDMGFETGDEILDLNGSPPESLSRFRVRLAGIQWGDRLDFLVRAGESVTHRVVLLQPDILYRRMLVTPGWKRLSTAVPDPRTAAPIRPPDTGVLNPPGESFLIFQEEKPVRIEVFRGENLDEVHVLDDNRFIVRSQYRDPLPDGSVQVIYSRDPNGSVMSSVRTGRDGVLIP